MIDENDINTLTRTVYVGKSIMLLRKYVFTLTHYIGEELKNNFKSHLLVSCPSYCETNVSSIWIH